MSAGEWCGARRFRVHFNSPGREGLARPLPPVVLVIDSIRAAAYLACPLAYCPLGGAVKPGRPQPTRTRVLRAPATRVARPTAIRAGAVGRSSPSRAAEG